MLNDPNQGRRQSLIDLITEVDPENREFGEYELILKLSHSMTFYDIDEDTALENLEGYYQEVKQAKRRQKLPPN